MNPFPFSFENQEIRVITNENGEPWFVAKEIAGALGYSDAEAMTRRLDDDEKRNLQVVGFGPRGVTVINESGLYSAILGSTKEAAKRFKRWVTSEVLPSVRKTGGYTAPQTPDQQARLGLDLLFAEKAAQMLNLPNSGKLGLLQKIENVYHLTPMLPAYAVDEGTGTTGSSRVAHSATELLKRHGSPISTRSFNQNLQARGMLTEQTRASTKTPSKTKAFWSVTGEGLRFGKNGISPANPKETHPEWFDDCFAELLELISGPAAGKAA